MPQLYSLGGKLVSKDAYELAKGISKEVEKPVEKKEDSFIKDVAKVAKKKVAKKKA